MQKASHADDELVASLAEQTMEEEAATLKPNTIVNDSNNNMGLTWVPVRRTVSKYGMIRNKAREIVETAKRRNFESLVHQWEQNMDWQNSVIRAGWSRDDMLYAMTIAETKGKDPAENKVHLTERQQKANTTKAMRFEKDKNANSRNTPDQKKSPFYSTAMVAVAQGGDTKNNIFLSGARLGGQTLRTLAKSVEERALSQKESWYFKVPAAKVKAKTKTKAKIKAKIKAKT